MSRKKAVRQLRSIFAKEKLVPRDLGPPRIRTPYKWAQILRFTPFYEVHSFSILGTGHIDPEGYLELHPIELDDTELGQIAKTALAASRFLTPNHTDWDRVLNYWKLEQTDKLHDQLKAKAGVKTLKALYNGAANVSLIQEDGQITITPSRHERGDAWGRIADHDPRVLPESVSDEEFGTAIRRELDISAAAK